MSLSLRPDRVLISSEGDAILPSRALERNILWDVIFIRKDGWSLGAPKGLAFAAEALWSDEWVAVIRDGAVHQYYKKG
ncbi:MAG: hypothetical protein DRP83_00615 [Planctomycetota bacterium]|nr:MAG: hypothetical protein DRP83_00615 [Planctomycetota bacterium]